MGPILFNNITTQKLTNRWNNNSNLDSANFFYKTYYKLCCIKVAQNNLNKS